MTSGGSASPVEVRELGRADVGLLRAFFSRIPERDRTFFREDVLAVGAIERWVDEARGRRTIALIDDDVVGYLALLPGVGWSRHVGEMRLVVDPQRRRRGLGRLLARQAVVEATQLTLTKLVVEVVAEQEATVAMFRMLGFEPEGLLREHVRSQDGEQHDLLILSHFVDELSTAMSSVGIDDAIAAS